MNTKAKRYYDEQYTHSQYAALLAAEKHSLYNELKDFIDQYRLNRKRCLEIGCGRGAFQDLVRDYIGVDITDSVRQYIRKPFYQCSATDLPFRNNVFDAVWSCRTLEHVNDPEKALKEMRRVLRHGGLIFLAPAWHCRPWASEGYPVRPYSDFDLKGKMKKSSIPIRNSVYFRAFYLLPWRFIRLLSFLTLNQPRPFKYKILAPNYKHYWMSDSDAVNSMDPYEAILWFASRGDSCVSHFNSLSQFFIRTGSIIFHVKKEK